MSLSLFTGYYILNCDLVYLADKLVFLDGDVWIDGIEAPSPLGTSVHVSSWFLTDMLWTWRVTGQVPRWKTLS